MESVRVLDGGFASQLGCHVKQAVDGDPLWSARFLHTDPEAVVSTHLDFLRAGSDLILTNTYQASVDGFVKYLGLTREDAVKLIKQAVILARSAIRRFQEEHPDSASPTPLVVGSVGPFGASLHDGSEYTGSYAKTVPQQIMAEWHRPRIEALLEAGVDLLAFETIPCLKEAEVLLDLLKEYPSARAWLSFSCKDERSTSYGENFQSAAKKCFEKNPKQIIAVGVNCLSPKNVESLLKGLNKGRKSPIPLIAYPNSGESYNAQLGWIESDKCEPVHAYVSQWLDLGVKYIGGCCRTYASDISRIRHEVHKWQMKAKSKETT